MVRTLQIRAIKNVGSKSNSDRLVKSENINTELINLRKKLADNQNNNPDIPPPPALVMIWKSNTNFTHLPY